MRTDFGGDYRELKVVGDGTTFDVWVKGAAKSSWDPYGVIQHINAFNIVSYQYYSLRDFRDDEPTGTYQATASLYGRVNYSLQAGTAQSVAWAGVSSKPETATRWPSWSEVTGKPSTFTPSDHTHSYLPLSGGELSGKLTVKSTSYQNQLSIFRNDGANNATITFYNLNDGFLGNIGIAGSAQHGLEKELVFVKSDSSLNRVYHAGNLTPKTLTLSTSTQTYITAGGTNYTLKLPDSDPYTSARTPTTHYHGLSHSNFYLSIPSQSTDLSWKASFGMNMSGNWLFSYRINGNCPSWMQYSWSSGIAFGGADTKAAMSVNYSSPAIRFAAGSGTSDTAVPAWTMSITGVNNENYNLASFLTSQDHYKTSITSGTAGTSSATSGSTVSIPYISVNENGHVTGYGTHTHTITGFASSSHDHTYINKNFEGAGISNVPFTGRRFEYGILTSDSSNPTDIKAIDSYCQVEYINLPWYTDTYGGQIMLGANSGKIGYRTRHGGTWSQTKELLHQLNYTDYTVKKDGTGASGTWGINITGSSNISNIASCLSYKYSLPGSTTNTNASEKYWFLFSSVSNGSYVGVKMILSTMDIEAKEFGGILYVNYRNTNSVYQTEGAQISWLSGKSLANCIVTTEANGTSSITYRVYMKLTRSWSTPVFTPITQYGSYTWEGTIVDSIQGNTIAQSGNTAVNTQAVLSNSEIDTIMV